MLELEMQKLTAAVEALTKALQMTAPLTAAVNAAEQSYREDDEARRKMQDERRANRRAGKVTKEEVEALVEAATPVENTECADQPLKDNIPEGRPDITETSLKTMALEIVRADSSARALILAILAEHGAKTVTQLDHKHHHEVHGRFLSLAYDIAKNGEVTQ
jgi:nucleoid-associated protein YgaU